MDNQPNGPSGVSPESVTPAQQSSIAQPAQSIQQVVPPQPVSPQTSGGKAKYIIGGIVAAVLLIFGVLFVMALPSIQANAKATAFMEAVKKNDEKAMQDLSGSGRDGITDKLHAALKTATYKHTDTNKKDKTYVVKFDVAGSEAVQDTAIVVESGKVTNLLINTKRGAVATTTEVETQTETSTAAAGACLSVDDLRAVGTTNIDTLAIPQTLANFYFKADSTEYDSTRANDFSLRDVGRNVKTYDDRQFTLTATGFVNDANASAANSKLANERAAKVKADLVNSGVNANRIVIGTPDNGTSADPEVYRTVVVKISVPSNCSNR